MIIVPVYSYLTMILVSYLKMNYNNTNKLQFLKWANMFVIGFSIYNVLQTDEKLLIIKKKSFLCRKKIYLNTRVEVKFIIR